MPNAQETWFLDQIDNSSSTTSTMSSNWAASNSTDAVIITKNIRDLEAVQDPIQSVIAWMFYLTAFFSLIFNISAIVLLVSQFRRRRSATSKSSSRLPLSYSPSVKVPLSVNNNTTLVTTANSNSTTTTFQNQTTLGHLHHHQHSFYHHNHHQQHPNKSTRSSGHKIRSGSSQLRIYLLNLFLNDILIALFTTPFSYTDFM